MSSDIDTYFERLDVLKQYNRQVDRYKIQHESRLRGPINFRLRPTREEWARMTGTEVVRLGVREVWNPPHFGYDSPNWLVKKNILKDGKVWHEAQLDELWKRKSEFEGMAEFWRLSSVIASRCSRGEESENFRRKYRGILAEENKEADIKLQEICIYLGHVERKYSSILRRTFRTHSVIFGGYDILGARWPLSRNSTKKEMLGAMEVWRQGSYPSSSTYDGKRPFPYGWGVWPDISGHSAVRKMVSVYMLSGNDLDHILRGRSDAKLRRVEIARCFHDKLPFLRNRLKRCLERTILMYLGNWVKEEETEVRTDGIDSWVLHLSKTYSELLGNEVLESDRLRKLVKNAMSKMTLPGIHAMAVDPSLAPSEQSIEEELYFRVKVELFLDVSSRMWCKWRYGIDMDGGEWADYCEEQDDIRVEEEGGLLEADVNEDLIAAYIEMRIEKIDMLRIDKKHKKLEEDSSFQWALDLEDDLMHLHLAGNWRTTSENMFENIGYGRSQGGLNILSWHTLCDCDFGASEDHTVPGTRLSDYLWKIMADATEVCTKKSGLRTSFSDAKNYARGATKLLGIAGGVEELLSIERPLERFDAILGPYLEIDSKVTGLVEHMMDEDNEYSSETMDMVRKVLDGKMGEEERQLLTALVDGETSSGYAFDADTLYEWVERWDLLDHPEALGEILGGADFDAVAVKHGLMQ